MNRVSINARTTHEAASGGDIEIALFYIEHPDLDVPIRLSTDPTERLSEDPLMYGTRSSWMGSNVIEEPFLFILASAELPSDIEDAPAAATIVLDNLDSSITEVLRSFSKPAVVSMCVVMDQTPDLPELEYHGMIMTGASGSINEVSVQISRAAVEDEVVPTARFTKDRFPGLFA